MKPSIAKALELSTQASVIAKELARLAARETSSGNEDLHEKSLDMLLTCSQLDNILKTLQEHEENRSEFSFRTFDEKTPDEIEATEVIKVNRRIPRWARNPNQINSKILACYLKTEEQDGVVTEESLREAFVRSGDNEEQFNKNFPQMKMISERNHGKVFQVINERVTIWPPAAEAVDTFKLIYQGGN